MVSRSARCGLLALALAGCGRIGFSEWAATTDADADTTRDAAADSVTFDTIVLVSDDFERTSSGDWGAAPIGGTWEIFNPDGASLDVATGRGQVVVNGSPTYTDANITANARDVEVRAVISFDQIPTSGTYYARLSARVSAISTGYMIETSLTSTGQLRARLAAVVNAVETQLTPNTVVVSSVTANAEIALVLRVTGAAPSLCAKIWTSPQTEPVACTLTASDSTPELAVPGKSYTVVEVIGAPTPVTIAFDSFRYLQVGPQ